MALMLQASRAVPRLLGCSPSPYSACFGAPRSVVKTLSLLMNMTLHSVQALLRAMLDVDTDFLRGWDPKGGTMEDAAIFALGNTFLPNFKRWAHSLSWMVL